MDAPTLPEKHALAEDLLLLLFDPRTGSIAGDGAAVSPTLAGAVLVDLAVQERVEIAERMTWRGQPVHAAGRTPPADPLLRDTWRRVAAAPVDVQTRSSSRSAPCYARACSDASSNGATYAASGVGSSA